MQAINRQIAHYSYHVGQIVLLAKHFRSESWHSLTVPRNRSAEFEHTRSHRRSQPALEVLLFWLNHLSLSSDKVKIEVRNRRPELAFFAATCFLTGCSRRFHSN